jgi:hypothetical protein
MGKYIEFMNKYFRETSYFNASAFKQKLGDHFYTFRYTHIFPI